MTRWSRSVRAGNETTAGARRPRRSFPLALRLDRVADGAQDLADLAAQEDQGDDRDDRDEREDQRVLRETLAILVAADLLHHAKIEIVEERHVAASWMSTHPRTRAAPIYGRLTEATVRRWYRPARARTGTARGYPPVA